ncbi:MAG: amino acid ABC transporter ATP-binding/permease protein [Erysipelotrichaceae bacterium]
MKKQNNMTIMAKLITLVKPMLGTMLLAISMGIIGHLSASFITIIGGYSILAILQETFANVLPTLFAMAVGLALLRALFRYGEQYCNHYIAFKILALIRNKVFVALRALSPAKLEGRDRGDLIYTITSDIELLEVFYAHTISPIAIAFLFSLLMVGFIGQFHFTLALIALFAYFSVGVIIPITTSRKNKNLGLTLRNQSGELSSYVLESIRGLDETLQYNTGQARLAGMNERTDALLAKEDQIKHISAHSIGMTNFTILGFDLLMLLAALVLYQQGHIGFEGVLLSTIAMMSSFGPVVALANLGSTLQHTLASGKRVLALLEEKPIVKEVVGATEVAFNGATLKQVVFGYDEKRILNGFSLDIAQNQIIGIKGPSGSGKSTLLKLLMRFWEAQHGHVMISERAIEHINTCNLRDMQSFVTQDTHLFHDSIRKNLLVAKWDATEEEMMEACKKASIHEFIMALPHGYDTSVGELGDFLSGGERQRIGLARAFLHDAPFMLLDEPTSNLDSLNEAIILRSLKEARKDKTIVLVSHRDSSMRVADSIVNVEKGRTSYAN